MQGIKQRYMYRAKDESGNFRTGILMHGANGMMIDWIKIDPETLGQCTGIEDKHGKPIFEGDILKAAYDTADEENYIIQIVVWNGNGWHLKGGRGRLEPLDAFNSPFVEIVGNVTRGKLAAVEGV